jgi:hypothetical protein
MPTRVVTVTTSATQILSYNNQRTTASFTNNGTAVIFVSNDQTGITTNGYPIAVGGALDLIRALGDEPQSLWFASVATATQEMRILEAYGDLPVVSRPPELPPSIEIRTAMEGT